MKKLYILGIAAMLCASPAHAGFWTPTNYGIGADAEVRDHQLLNNFGASTEIASRTRNDVPLGDPNDGNDRDSSIYIKIDLTNRQMPADGKTKFRMTYRNTNPNSSRISDTVTPNPEFRTGMAIYGLTNYSLAGWQENTITYFDAPGITFDGDVGTKDFNSDLTLLGIAEFPAMGTQNRLPVGGSLVFESALLDTFVTNAMAAGQTSVTLVANVAHSGDTPFSNWKNFNYLFNPKEQVTLLADTGYDADTTDPNNVLGSPWSAASNANGEFSPALWLEIPEPASLALMGISAVCLLLGRRRAA